MPKERVKVEPENWKKIKPEDPVIKPKQYKDIV